MVKYLFRLLDHLWPWAFVLPILGAIVYGVLGALAGTICSFVLAAHGVASEAEKEWQKTYCPICGRVCGSYRKADLENLPKELKYKCPSDGFGFIVLIRESNNNK